jgi:hypothetical protein
MTTPLNGQIIGQAERHTRAVLNRLLADTGTSFEQWVAVNLAATAGPSDLASSLAAGLRLDPLRAGAVISSLVEDGLLTADGTLTPLGNQRFQEISTGIAGITQRLYGDLPADDLIVAGRILTTITDRARAELAP